MQFDSPRESYERAILTPFSICLALLLAGFLLQYWWQDRHEAKESRELLRASVENSMKLAERNDTDKLSALLKLVVRDPELQRAFGQRDRARLLAAAQPVFEQLRAEHRVTHFYFMTPERQMFLRVHNPTRFGDIIERKSAREAARLGQVASGLEIGPFGLFTLRVVSPWRDAANNLLGYIELGMEIDQTLVELQRLVGYDFAMLVDKKHLNKDAWLKGMESIGRKVDWDRLPSHVVIGRTGFFSDEVLSLYQGQLAGRDPAAATFKTVHGERRLAFDESPLKSLEGLVLGKIITVRDVTEADRNERNLILRAILVLVVVWVVLMVLARRVINHVYERLVTAERQREEFKHRARRDALTGLFNHASLFFRLTKSMERCKDEGTTLAVLMFDVDHFKQLNDTHGHAAGDEVLRRVARVLQHGVRPEDSVGRYGGEEFAIALPGMDEAGALRVGERIRSEIERLEIESDGGVLRITISGGVAQMSGATETAEALVARADRAMYRAKNSGRNQICL